MYVIELGLDRDVLLELPYLTGVLESLIEIRLPDGTVKPGSPLVFFDKSRLMHAPDFLALFLVSLSPLIHYTTVQHL